MQSAIELATEMQYKSSHTAVEALCTSLVCYCLHVYFHVTHCSHVIGVMSEETCLVLTCL